MDRNGCFFVDDDLLNFSLDEEDEHQQQEKTTTTTTTAAVKELSFSSSSSDPISQHDDDVHHNHPFPEFIEEELEWLSNKDAFPAVETCFDILSGNPGIVLDHHSPVSVLENSSSSSDTKNNGNGNSNGSTIVGCCGGLYVPLSYPVGKRSKRRRTRRKAGFLGFPSQRSPWLNQVNVKNITIEQALPLGSIITDNNSSSIGRRCLHCLAEKTPQWRAGPLGPKTLCNACGVRFKSGRLVPEYRPASSPTFSAAIHSNSHRKIVEMRRQKQVATGDLMANLPCGYRVG